MRPPAGADGAAKPPHRGRRVGQRGLTAARPLARTLAREVTRAVTNGVCQVLTRQDLRFDRREGPMVRWPLMPSPCRAVVAALVGVVLAAGCATSGGSSTPTVSPAPATVAPAASTTTRAELAPRQAGDPVLALIALSQRHFALGESELQVGHLDTARAAFNDAVHVLLAWPAGARGEPRLREHFDRLVERISALEVVALTEGDGFMEPQYEPATRDELLAITFDDDATGATQEAVVADLAQGVHDIDIPLNQRVLSYVDLLSGRMKGHMEDGLSRGVRYLPMIFEVFRAEGLPLDLAYVPLIESAFKPTAVSRARARGIWQFMSATATENGLKQDWYLDERAEPEKATRAAARYLKTLHGMFGDWHLALAAYNGGPGRVQRAMRRSGLSSFWDLSRSSSFLPQETRNYVPLILAAAIIARNPEQYGLQVVPAGDSYVERIALPHPVDIRRVAEWIETPVQVLRELNPELRRWTTPVRDTGFELKVPDGTGYLVRDQLARANPESLATFRWHTVKKGESLVSIARTLKVNRQELAEANYLPLNARVREGERLIVPREPPLLLASASGPSAQVDAVPAASAGPAAAGPAERERLIYRVQRGDTLYSIARTFRTTVAAIRDWNRLRGTLIRVGDRLTIYTTSSARTD